MRYDDLIKEYKSRFSNEPTTAYGQIKWLQKKGFPIDIIISAQNTIAKKIVMGTRHYKDGTDLDWDLFHTCNQLMNKKINDEIEVPLSLKRTQEAAKTRLKKWWKNF